MVIEGEEEVEERTEAAVRGLTKGQKDKVAKGGVEKSF